MTPAAADLTFDVNSGDDLPDAVPGDGACATAGRACTLRAAVMEANARDEPIVIELDEREYTLTRDGADEDLGATGDLDVVKPNVVIRGGGLARTTLRIVVDNRVVDVRATGSLILQDVRVQEGLVDRGGGIRNLGSLVVDRVLVRQCFAGFGGGIYHDGTDLVVRDSTVAWNGGLTGGGVSVFGPARFERVTIHDNLARNGGGIMGGFGAAIELVNVTISQNRAADIGGGFLLGTSTVIRSSTIADNFADADGGGIHTGFASDAHEIADSIVAGNAAGKRGPDCFGSIVLDSPTLIADAADCTLTDPNGAAITGVDAGLEPLAANSSFIWTHRLASTSPALDAGSALGCHDADGAALATDARSLPRSMDGRCSGIERCDLGAYERAPIRDDDADEVVDAGCPGGTDCDDHDAAIHPDAFDICNGVDDDCTGVADDALTCTPVPAQLLDLRNGDTRALKWKTRQPALPLGARGGLGDPTCRDGAGGAVLDVFGLDDSGQTATLPLSCARWTAKEKAGRVVAYTYKDPSQTDGPCRTVKLTEARIVAACAGEAIAYDLGRGERAVGLTLTTGATTVARGATQYCARFEGSSVKRDDAARFQGVKAAAPAVCPAR